MKYAIGIDIGGTKIASGIVNEHGDLIQEEKIPSDPSDRENMFANVVKCVHNLLDHSSIPLDQIVGIGAGVPGKVDVDKGVAIFQNNIPWGGFPLAERLEAAFGVERVRIDNDVYMATFAEWKKANLAGNELFVYVTISTGISCAIIQGGKFLRGAGFAGELGLVPVQRKGAAVAGDGQSEEGTPFADDGSLQKGESIDETRLENVAAGPAMEKAANLLYGTTDMSGVKLFAKFYDGDKQAVELVGQMADSIAQSVYMLTSIIDPHKIVFGGSIAFYNPSLVDLIKEKLRLRLIDEQKHILDNLDVSTMENGQGIIGAGLRALSGVED